MFDNVIFCAVPSVTIIILPPSHPSPSLPSLSCLQSLPCSPSVNTSTLQPFKLYATLSPFDFISIHLQRTEQSLSVKSCCSILSWICKLLGNGWSGRESTLFLPTWRHLRFKMNGWKNIKNTDRKNWAIYKKLIAKLDECVMWTVFWLWIVHLTN